MINHRIYKICLLKSFNNQKRCTVSIRKFCSETSQSNSRSLQSNELLIGDPTDKGDDLYQFNEQLIRKLKKSKLFDIEFMNVKFNDQQQPTINLPADVQRYVPCVSKVIADTMTEQNIRILEVWKAKMIKKLGPEGFQKYQNDLFSKGKRLHKNIEYKLKKKEEKIQIDDDISGYWTSLQPTLSEIKDVYLTESKLMHPKLLYKGIVDCVAKLNRTDTLIDWKTSEKVKDTKTKLYDAPVQTAAYLGALNQSNLIDFELNRMSVVVAYSNGRAANYHQLELRDCQEFLTIWTNKLKQYWIKHLSSAPADPCLIDHFDNLLEMDADMHKKIYKFDKQVNKSKNNDKSSIETITSSNKSSSKSLSKGYKPKTKDELIYMLQNKKKVTK